MLPRELPRLFLAAACATFLAGGAFGQRDLTPPNLSLDYYPLTFLGDPALYKDLKLTDTQVKKLLEHRDTWLPDYQSAARNEDRRRELQAANTKTLGEILEPAQLKRLREITLQQIVAGRAFSRTAILGNMRELVEGLKLTDDQRRKLRAGDGIDTVLTKDQEKPWKEMLGEQTALVLQSRLPGGAPGGPGGGFGVPGGGFGPGVSPTTPTRLTYLNSEDVRKDLKLSKEQIDKLPDLRKVWTDATQDARQWAAADREAKVKAATDKVNEAITAALEPGQAKRLGQIVLQRATSGRSNIALFTHADVVRELKLTDDQKEKVAAVTKDRRAALVQVFLTGDGSEAVTAAVAGHHKKTYEQLHAILTADQKTRLDDLVGPAFTGQVTAEDRGRPGGGGAPPGRGTGTPTRLIAVEMLFASSPDLAKELKLSDDETKKLADVRTRYTTETRTGARPAAERDQMLDRFEKELTDTLGADKRRRMRQVVLQVTTRSAAFLRSVVLPELDKDLKLTDDQKRQFTDGTELVKVLTADQQKKWKEMTGDPFAGNLQPAFGRTTGGQPGDRGGDRVGRPAPAVPVRLQFAEQQSIQDELKLTDDQRKQIADLDKVWTEAVTGYRDWTAAERTEKIRAATTDTEGRLAKLFEPAQAKRFEQIILQRGLVAGFRGAGSTPGTVSLAAPAGFGTTTSRSALATILAYGPVDKSLELTDKQRTEIREKAADGTRVVQLFTSEIRTGREDSPEYTKARQALARLNDDKVLAVLTGSQKDKLKELVGEPFEGPLTPRRPGGGFGGRGPGGGAVPRKGE